MSTRSGTTTDRNISARSGTTTDRRPRHDTIWDNNGSTTLRLDQGQQLIDALGTTRSGTTTDRRLTPRSGTTTDRTLRHI
jgi:hypothetical protein